MSDTIGYIIILSLSLSFLPVLMLLFWALFFPRPRKIFMEKATIWDREGLRSTLLAQCDKVRNSVLWRWMSDQEKQLSTCAKTFWSANTDVTNNALDSFAKILNGD